MSKFEEGNLRGEARRHFLKVLLLKNKSTTSPSDSITEK